MSIEINSVLMCVSLLIHNSQFTYTNYFDFSFPELKNIRESTLIVLTGRTHRVHKLLQSYFKSPTMSSKL